LMVFVKGVVGILARSTALVADAVHSISDLGSDFVVIAGLRMADRPPDRSHRYGHGKFETLAAFILAVILMVTAGGIAMAAVRRIATVIAGNSLAPPGVAALPALVAALVIKEWLYRYTRKWGLRLNRPALLANAVHHRSDALSSLAALMGVAGARFLGPSWRILDPLAALMVAGFILAASLGILRESVGELLESALEPEMEAEIRRIAKGVPGVSNPHNLRGRRIGRAVAMEMHIEVDPDLKVGEANRISREVERRLEERFGADIILSIHCDPGEIRNKVQD